MGATRKIYLPEDLNVAKMHQMFVDSCPAREVSYESYIHIFNTTINIGFGYPIKDTYNVCDELKQRMSHAESVNNPESDRMKQELELCQRKAATFYKRKREAKDLARIDNSKRLSFLIFRKIYALPTKHPTMFIKGVN